MPRELPRHELQVRKETILGKKEYAYAERYDEVERKAQRKEKAAGRDTKNPEKRTVRSATSIVADALKSLNAATTRLTEIATVPIKDLQYVGLSLSDLRGHAQESSTDLAGFFNDYKLSLEHEKNLSEIDIQVFDLLEFAEQKGGIGHWLEQWNALMRDPVQRTDVSKMADIADSIRAGIEFQKALVEQHFSGDDAKYKTVMEPKVSTHLSSLAFEISRQVSEALQGRFETDSPLSAARNILQRENSRESQTRDIALAFESMSIANIFMLQRDRHPERGSWVSLPTENSVKSVRTSLSEWQEAATSMTALVQTIGKPDYPGAHMELSIARQLIEKQITVVDSLGEAAKAVFNEPHSISPGGKSHFGKENTLFVLSRIATTVLEQHRSWATQLKNPAAKQKLLEQVLLSENICTMIEKKRADSSLPHFYDETLAASHNGSLHELWKDTKKTLLNSLELTGVTEAVKDTEKLFSGGLGGYLDDWAKRQKNPQDIRGLAWHLTSTLREYELGVRNILEKYTEPLNGTGYADQRGLYLMEMMEQRISAIRNAIAQGLEENIKAGLG